MLSEDAAVALLRQYCRLLTRAGVSDVGLRLGVQVPHLKRRALRSGRDLGAKLRLALGVAQAVSCCRGFEPAAQQVFWRRTVRELWSVGSQGCAFSAATFAHVGINWTSRSPDEDEFWIGFLHGTPEWNARLASILETLTPQFARGQPPPLCVSLESCSAAEDQLGRRPQCAVWPEALKVILRAALTTPKGLSNARSPVTHLGLVVEYLTDQDPTSTRETLDLLARVRRLECSYLRVSINQLTIQLASRGDTLCERQAPSSEHQRVLVCRERDLGAVLRTLLVQNGRVAPLVHSVAILGCCLSDFRLLGAALSALAVASPPVEALRCCGLFDDHGQILHLAWLAYALRRRQGPPLSLDLVATGTAMNETQRAYLEQLVAIGMPLRDVVGEALRLRLGGDDTKVAQLNVECLSSGSTVRLARGTRLFVEPMRVSDAYVVVTLAHEGDGEDLDLVVHMMDHGGYVGVVYGGYGLLWAEAAAVVEWQSSDVVMHEAGSSVITEGPTALSVLFDSINVGSSFKQTPLVHRATAMLSFFGCETLDTLKLSHAVVLHEDLTQLLESFPRLCMLSLDCCAVESLEPLAAAYRSRRTRVAVVLLHGSRDLSVSDRMLATADGMEPKLAWSLLTQTCDLKLAVAWVKPLLDVLVDGTTHGVLRVLHVDIRGMCAKDQRAVIVRLASSLQSLTSFNVTCLYRLWTTCSSQLVAYQDDVLPDPPRVRCAVLSVLRAFSCGTPEIGRMILAWSEGGVVRLVTWDS